MDDFEELDFAQKKHYLKILIENQLYNGVSILEESGRADKDEKINALIEDFYETNKDYYEISCIEEVIAALEEIKTVKYKIEHDNDNEER